MPSFPSPDPAIPELEPFIRAWSLTEPLHRLKDPATESAIAEAERVLARPLPRPLRLLYRTSDGLSLYRGNLNVVPLKSDGRRNGLETNSAQLREWGWPIPDELLVFGDDGADELFGIWAAARAPESGPQPVVMVGEVLGEHEGFALVGTSFFNFLKAWTVYYAALCVGERDRAKSDATMGVLGVPESFHGRRPDDLMFRDLLRWADPTLSDPQPEPYRKGVSAEHLRRAYGSSPPVSP